MGAIALIAMERTYGDTNNTAVEPPAAAAFTAHLATRCDFPRMAMSDRRALLVMVTDRTGVVRDAVVAPLAPPGYKDTPEFLTFAEHAINDAALTPACGKLPTPPAVIGKANVLAIMFYDRTKFYVQAFHVVENAPDAPANCTDVAIDPQVIAGRPPGGSPIRYQHGCYPTGEPVPLATPDYGILNTVGVAPLRYGTPLVNRNTVMAALADGLPSGAYIAWLDQVYPMYRKVELKPEAVIGIVGSTNHRFRVLTVFRKR